MKLYIAEKPSLGRAIAEALPGPRRRGEGCIRVGNGDCVSWCLGHLLEQVEPADYNADYKTWRLEHLPIVPEQWRLRPRSGSRKQLAVLRRLLKSAQQIVHAGDPDREGQLLVDEVIDYLRVPTRIRDRVQRCLINDLNPAAVSRALGRLRDNREFIPLSTSALARSRADWLYGINLTRATTLQGRKVGYRGVLSVGRVQTPVLGLVVRRDREIENFVPRAFYQVIAHLNCDRGEAFCARWQPSTACLPWQDEEGRVLSRSLAENVAARIGGQTATVTDCVHQAKKQPAPLPYNLSSLQIDAAKRFAMSAQQVLDTCQLLYERHKLLTYPRSDCRYLPRDHFDQRHAVLAAVAATSPTLGSAVQQADSSLQSRAWNDDRVDAHHAIIPTARKMDGSKLGPAERNIYQLVARQYLAQFYPVHEYRESRIDLDIAGGTFIARARESLAPGWKTLFPPRKDRDDAVGNSTEHALNTRLPLLDKGDHCCCERGELVAKETTAPSAFDDASLLAAMTGIARYVSEPEIRRVLKDSDGLGTEATRAGIIELLFARDFLQRQGRKIHATAAGRGLIDSLPAVVTTPDMTAHWEMQLNAISRKEASYSEFMAPLVESVRHLTIQAQSALPAGLKNLAGAATAAAKGHRRRKKTRASAARRTGGARGR